MSDSPDVKPATGKLGILLPGLGAVSTTMIAGVMAARKGIGTPIGSLTQMQPIRLGKRRASVTRWDTCAWKGMAMRAPVAASHRKILPSAVATMPRPSGVQA